MRVQAAFPHRGYGFRIASPTHATLPCLLSSLPDIGAGFCPVEAEDSYEIEQIAQREYSGAITASLSENITDEKEVRWLFVEWLKIP